VSKRCLRCTTLSVVTWKRVLVDMRKTRGRKSRDRLVLLCQADMMASQLRRTELLRVHGMRPDKGSHSLQQQSSHKRRTR
jgi:hypothetical protein